MMLRECDICEVALRIADEKLAAMFGKLPFLRAALLGGVAFFATASADQFSQRYQAIIESKGKTPEAERFKEQMRDSLQRETRNSRAVTT